MLSATGSSPSTPPRLVRDLEAVDRTRHDVEPVLTDERRLRSR